MKNSRNIMADNWIGVSQAATVAASRKDIFTDDIGKPGKTT